MNESEQMLRLAAIIDGGKRVCADGYTTQVGYAKPVGNTYTAPIGDLSTTQSEADTVLETAYKTDTEQSANKPVSRVRKRDSGVVYPPVDIDTVIAQGSKETNLDDTKDEVPAKKTFTERIKEKPLLYIVLAVVTIGAICLVVKHKK